MKIRTTAGFTLLEIMIITAIIGLLAAICIPNFVKARSFSQTDACINNLRQIDGAIQQWSLEQNQASTSTVNYAAISSFMKRAVVCPAGGSGATFASTYTIVDCQTKPACNIISSTHFLPN
jgi:type II secretory pathway pseudopilin PulG